MVEGSGIFKCEHNHDKEFVTTSKEEYDKHLSDGNHTEYGSKECLSCNKQGPNQDHIIGKNYICDDCKKEMMANA